MQRTPSLFLASAFLLSATVATASPALPTAHAHCGTPDRLADALTRRHLLPPSAERALPGGTPKSLRDSFGLPYTVRQSENFAVKWTNANVSEGKAQQVLTSLELSWSVYIDMLGHAPPQGTTTFKMNLYISGPTDTPDIDFAGGYATIDNQGFPFMVVSEDVTTGPSLDHVVSHEFYHDVQFGADAYGGHPWYWEATADWASQEVYPGVSDMYGFIGAYGLLPELPVFAFNNPFGADPVAGVHQYGAAIFPRFISEYVGSPLTIAQSWETAGPNEDPINAIDRLTPGVSVLEVFGEFAARNAVWDYAAAAQIQQWVNSYASSFPEHSPTIARHTAAGTQGMVSPPPARLPRAMGYNVIEAISPPSGKVIVSIAGQPTGSRGTPATFSATVVSIDNGVIGYQPLTVTSGMVEETVDLPRQFPFYLVVAVPSTSRDESETYSYDYSLEPTTGDTDPDPDPDPVPGPDDGGCGCATGAGGQSGAGLALFLLVVVSSFRRGARRRDRRRE